MDYEAVYKVGLLTIIAAGWIGGSIWLSVEHHLGRHQDLEGWIPAIIILPMVAALAWPITPLIGFGYLVHRGIGLVVRPQKEVVLPPEDPCLVAAKHEVEEICSETPS